jgi:hypothetical protein
LVCNQREFKLLFFFKKTSLMIGRKLITISGKQLPPPPRKVIVERMPPIPSKPQPLIVERWLPYGSNCKRRV